MPSLSLRQRRASIRVNVVARGNEPRIIVSPDGSVACLSEPSQVAILRLPELTRVAEVGMLPGSSVAIAGASPRLLVLAPTGVVHIVDPLASRGPVELGSMKLDEHSTFAATSGSHVLATSNQASAIIGIDDTPTVSRLPTRLGVVSVAARLTPNHFIVQVGTVLEEWSGPLRAPVRRFRIERTSAAAHLGGGSRLIWMVPRDQPNEVTVLPLGNAPGGRIELPEPIVAAVGDPTGTSLAVIGAESGALWVVSCVDRSSVKVHEKRTLDVDWLDAHNLLRVSEATVEIVEVAGGRAKPTKSRPEPPREPPQTTSQALAAWKQQVAKQHETTKPFADPPPVTPPANEPSELGRSALVYQWRDAVATWARSMLRGSRGEPPLLAACTLHDVAARLGLPAESHLMLWFIYGAWLCGHDGVAPFDLVDLCGWDDALGRSPIAKLGCFAWARGRVHLRSEVAAALDERDPVFGTVIPSGIAATRRTAVLVSGNVDYVAIGRWAAPDVGALFAPSRRGLAQPARFLREARLRNLVPLVPAAWFRQFALPSTPAIVVVDQPLAASELDLPIALTWTDGDVAVIATPADH
jgi:hypothetical protein